MDQSGETILGLRAENAKLRAEWDEMNKQRQEMIRRAYDAELQVDGMRKIVEAAVAWNNEVPALSQIEAKLVSAVVAYLNKTEKRKHIPSCANGSSCHAPGGCAHDENCDTRDPFGRDKPCNCKVCES